MSDSLFFAAVCVFGIIILVYVMAMMKIYRATVNEVDDSNGVSTVSPRNGKSSLVAEMKQLKADLLNPENDDRRLEIMNRLHEIDEQLK